MSLDLNASANICGANGTPSLALETLMQNLPSITQATSDKLSTRKPLICRSTWKVEPLDGLEKCPDIRIVGEDPPFVFDPDSTSVESCIILTHPENSEASGPCKIQFELSPGHTLDRLHIVSEAKNLEFYSNETYLRTCKGELSPDSLDDFKMFMTDIKFEEEERIDSLKLLGVTERCWIMSLHLSTRRIKEVKQKYHSFQQSGNFDVDKLQSLLGNAQLSENATKFKNLFETFQRSPAPGMMDLAKHVPSNDGSTDNHMLKSLEFQLFSKALQQTEERIMKKIEEGQKEQNEKLDRILKLLEQQTQPKPES